MSPLRPGLVANYREYGRAGDDPEPGGEFQAGSISVLLSGLSELSPGSSNRSSASAGLGQYALLQY